MSPNSHVCKPGRCAFENHCPSLLSFAQLGEAICSPNHSHSPIHKTDCFVPRKDVKPLTTAAQKLNQRTKGIRAVYRIRGPFSYSQASAGQVCELAWWHSPHSEP